MSERTNWLHGMLKAPRVYEAVQQAMGAEQGRKDFARDFIRARAGDRVLDIGCGPAKLLAHLPNVDYVGWEPNASYVAQARATFGHRGTFHTGIFSRRDATALPKVDIAVLSAVLHHLDDDQALDLFASLSSVLKPDGRVVTLDNVYVDGQNPIAKMIISLDRGRNVRTVEGYRSLAASRFRSVEGTVVHKRFPPYTYFYMVAGQADR